MKFYLISDNIDTQMGMRIAGIEGVVAHTADEVECALDRAVEDEETAVVLMTDKAERLCYDKVHNIMLNFRRPLIVEIPDRHGSSDAMDAISKYVEEAIGIKL